GQMVGWRRWVEVEPQRPATGAQDVLRRRHAAADERCKVLRGERAEDFRTVVEVEDQPAGFPKHSPHSGEHDLLGPPTRLRVEGASSGPNRFLAAPTGLEVVVDAVHGVHE